MVGVGMSFEELPYLQNPLAPRIRVHGLQDVQFLSPNDVLFDLFDVQTENGVWVKKTAVYIEMPAFSVPPGIALTSKRIGERLIMPITAALARLPLIH